MPHTISNRRRSAAAAALVLVLVSLALAACGSSSTSSSSTTTTSKSSTSGLAAGQAAARGLSGRFTAIRECLKKNGITLPERKPGQRPSPGGGFLGGGGPTLPKGVSKAQYEAAVKKCGGNFARGFNPGTRFKSPAVQHALAKFAACMHANGVSVPAPNTSGKGPIFDTKGLNTSSPQFQAAEAKCRGDLQGAFRASPGAGAPPGAPATTG